MVDAVVDQSGKNPNTITGAESAYEGRGLVFGLLFWCSMAAAVFVMASTAVLPKQRRGMVFDFGRIDEAKPTTAITLTSSPNFFSHPAAFGLRGAYKWEHAHARSDEQQYRTPAIESWW